MDARARYATLPLLLAALAPKCPLCVAAYASAIGLGAVAVASPAIVRGSDVVLVLLLVAVSARVGQLAWRTRRALPAIAGLAGVALVCVGRWAIELPIAVRLAGLSLVAAAFVYSEGARQRPAPQHPFCAHCDRLGEHERR